MTSPHVHMYVPLVRLTLGRSPQLSAGRRSVRKTLDASVIGKYSLFP